MNTSDIGKLFLGVGIFLVLLGLLFLAANNLPFIKNLGKLPGDIAIKKEGFQFYFPITTSILISVVLSLIFWIFRK